MSILQNINVDGVPTYSYPNGFVIMVEYEYWGHANPIDYTYRLVNNEGKVIDEAYKGCVNEYLKKWGERFGKKSRIKL